MSLDTKGVKIGGGIPKILQPGNTTCKIVSVNLEEFKFKEGGYHLILNMESEDLGPDFEGFFIDKDKPELGRYKGQVGKVKAGEWAFADSETKTGIKVSRDTEIMKCIKTLCVSMGIVKWFEDLNDIATIELLVEKFNKDKPFEGKFLRYCLAGKEYMNKGGYPNFELFLPKFSKTGIPFEPKGVVVSKLIKFNPAEHIRKKKVENVDTFGEGSDIHTGPTEEFKLD